MSALANASAAGYFGPSVDGVELTEPVRVRVRVRVMVGLRFRVRVGLTLTLTLSLTLTSPR